MKILGIDYGRSKVGLAVADGPLAEPIKVVRYKDVDSLVSEIKNLIEKEEIEKVVVGVSEGQMGEESRKFASAISNQQPTLDVTTFDETLTSQDAQSLSIQAGINRKKRHQMEDAYAATIMLQNYLDNQP